MTCEETRALIHKYEAPEDFTHMPIDRSNITDFERQLRHHLPDQYTEFLKKYSQGGVLGMVTLGVNAFGQPTFLFATEDYRKFGLPKDLVVIEEDDDNANWCIDLKSESVVYWKVGSKKYERIYPDFCTYLHDRIHDFIDRTSTAVIS
jgi:hypothetical protein